MKENTRRPLTGKLFYLLFGPIVWAFHLAMIYAAHAMLCVRSDLLDGARANSIASLIVAATAVALALLVLAMFTEIPRRHNADKSGPAAATSFDQSVMASLALLSAIGVTWAGATALIVDSCLQLR